LYQEEELKGKTGKEQRKTEELMSLKKKADVADIGMFFVSVGLVTMPHLSKAAPPFTPCK